MPVISQRCWELERPQSIRVVNNSCSKFEIKGEEDLSLRITLVYCFPIFVKMMFQFVFFFFLIKCTGYFVREMKQIATRVFNGKTFLIEQLGLAIITWYIKRESDRKEKVSGEEESNVCIYHSKTQIAMEFLSFLVTIFFLFLTKRLYDQSWIKISVCKKWAKEERLFLSPDVPQPFPLRKTR